jgi:hypothetical protein
VKSTAVFGSAGLALTLALLSPVAMAQDKAPVAELGPPLVTARAEPAEAAKLEVRRPFEGMAGSWSGGGTITVSGGGKEPLRCRATHTVGQNNTSLSLSIRCASDSFKFELTSNVLENGGEISGDWKETSIGVAGSISGQAAGDRISAVASGGSTTAGISVITTGNRQTVSITPQGAFITGVQIALSKR